MIRTIINNNEQKPHFVGNWFNISSSSIIYETNKIQKEAKVKEGETKAKITKQNIKISINVDFSCLIKEVNN